MSTANVQVVRWGAEQARIGPWQGDNDVAYLSPLAGTPGPSIAFVRRCLDQLAGRGFSRVVTGALAVPEQAAFLRAGFTVAESLHVLSADLRSLSGVTWHGPKGDWAIRKAQVRDRPDVLDIDHLAFDPFWQLDQAGLAEAIQATPRARFRLAEIAPTGSGDGPRPVAYAITGRAGSQGFLQRLAVDPSLQRQGIGRALVIDGLSWLKRRAVDRAVVNTQLGNGAALALYESLGFRREPRGLSVLSTGIRP